MEKRKTQSLERSIERLIVIFLIIICVNIGLLYFLRTQVKVIGLLQGQFSDLEQDQKILASAEDIYQTYKDDIDSMLAVFPDEESVLLFLQTLEQLTKESSDESLVKFASFTPVAEGDKLFLLFTVTARTDQARLASLLSKLETLPYMTRIVALSVTWVDIKNSIVDVSMRLKLYVKNPFSTK